MANFWLKRIEQEERNTKDRNRQLYLAGLMSMERYSDSKQCIETVWVGIGGQNFVVETKQGINDTTEYENKLLSPEQVMEIYKAQVFEYNYNCCNFPSKTEYYLREAAELKKIYKFIFRNKDQEILKSVKLTQTQLWQLCMDDLIRAEEKIEKKHKNWLDHKYYVALTGQVCMLIDGYHTCPPPSHQQPI